MNRRETHLGLTHIVHPTDFSLASDVAFAHALKLTLAAKAKLRVIHYAEQNIDVDWNSFPKVKKTFVRWNVLGSESSEKDLGKLGVEVEGVIATGPDKVFSIFRYLDQTPPDLLVLATHQIDGLNRWLYKPVAEPIARHVKRPTLFVPPVSDGFISFDSGTISLERILIPITQLTPPQLAIDSAVDVARLLDVNRIEWKVFHVGELEEMPAVHLPTQEGWNWEKLAHPGQTVDQIHEIANEFSPHLIVMMTEGQHGLFDMLRGSTTERVMRAVRCPVLVIPVERET